MSPIFKPFDVQRIKQHRLQKASLRDRIIAQLIDGVLLGVLCSAIFYIFSNGDIYSVWVSPVIPQFLLEVEKSHAGSLPDIWWGGYYATMLMPYGKAVHLNYPAPLLWGLYGVYYTFFIAKKGQTPGKIVKQLVVLDQNHRPVSMSKSFSRWLGSVVSILPLGLGVWWAAIDPNGQTWHDKLVNTSVYYYEKR